MSAKDLLTVLMAFVVAGLLLVVPSAAGAAQGSDAVTAIVGATVIDGNGGSPLPDVTVVVQGKRIAEIGPQASVQVPRGARVIDGSGKYVTPGFIDTNVHLSIPGPRGWNTTYGRYWDRHADLVLQGVQLQLKYGVTTVRDTIRKLGTPLEDSVQGMDYVALQRSGDTDDFRAQAAYLKSGFVRDVPAGLVSAIVNGIEGHPGRLTQLILVQSGGAIGRVADEATAFSQRKEFANLLCAIGWPYPTDGSEHIAWIREFWPDLEPFTRGFYTNDLEEGHTTEVINANYRDNFNRLVAVKNRYDPNNLFRLNANVEPSV